MEVKFSLFPEQASRIAEEVDTLIHTVNAVSLFFALLIATLIVVFVVRYGRRKRPETPGATHMSYTLELVWTLVPFVVVMWFFTWGTKLYLKMFSDPPPGAYEIYVIGRRWMWKFQHPNGKREINQVHLPADTPVRFITVSQDVIHDLYLPAFRMKHDVLPMRYSVMGVTATRPGSYHLFCAEYCGTKHSNMVGRAVVLEPARFQEWLTEDVGEGGLASGGEALLEGLGCRTCHRPDSTAMAPRLEGLFGTKVPLEGGGTAVADENYLRESILSPKTKVTANYQPVMPSYQGRVSEEELVRIIAYLKAKEGSP